MQFKNFFGKDFRILLVKCLIFAILLSAAYLSINFLTKLFNTSVGNVISGKFSIIGMDTSLRPILLLLVAFFILTRKDILKMKSFSLNPISSLVFGLLFFLSVYFYYLLRVFIFTKTDVAFEFFNVVVFLRYFIPLLIVLFLSLAVFGRVQIVYFFNRYRKPIVISIIILLLNQVLAFFLNNFWYYLSFATSKIVYLFLSFSFHDAAMGLLPNNGISLGASNFFVNMFEGCAGTVSLLFFLIFFTLSVLVDWDRFSLKNLLWLYPVGLFGAFFMNVIRIYLLMLAGIFISPEFAVGGFHSNAGWVIYGAYFVLFEWFVYSVVLKNKRIKKN